MCILVQFIVLYIFIKLFFDFFPLFFHCVFTVVLLWDPSAGGWG